MRAMIMAAGRGERMRPLTDHLPKPLLPILGVPMIQYHIKALAHMGIQDIVINVSHLAEKFYEVLQEGQELGVKLHYSYEPEPLEWAGGIVQALPLLGHDPFLVISGDIYTDFSFVNLSLNPEVNAQLVLVDNPPHHRRGDYALVDGMVGRSTGSLLNYAGMGLFRPELFAGLSPGKRGFREVIEPEIELNHVAGEYFSGLWYNLGTVAQLQEVNQHLAHK